ncbi:hypothetical protein LR48_Vigan09g131000 [Vigna angularis]|uniref:Uncharacterized protein n=1 Tax=Phaseolus angularis TaxID=3914 RepID=A0A0L9VC59_PHAAN|nr:hypothetical protein LR48_Vigan09g131000 [Vigna angularis]
MSSNYIFARMENGERWRYSLGLAAVPPFMIRISAGLLPDSLSSLIEQGLDEKAKIELIKIRTLGLLVPFPLQHRNLEFIDLCASSAASSSPTTCSAPVLGWCDCDGGESVATMQRESSDDGAMVVRAQRRCDEGVAGGSVFLFLGFLVLFLCRWMAKWIVFAVWMAKGLVPTD